MNNILFSHSYFMRFDPKQWATGQPYAPLGTIYAAAVMRQNGFPVFLFDSMFAASADEIIPEIEKYRPSFFVIYDDGFNYLTKMCLTNMREAAFRMSRLAKESGAVVIVSGSDATDHYEQYLEEGADFILIGEGEQTLLELIRAIHSGGHDFSRIAGLAFRTQQGFVKTPPRKLMSALDEMPMPAWDLVAIERYRSVWLSHNGRFSLNMSTTRGCPFKCNWCAKPIYGNRYHARSPMNVVEELKWLMKNYSFDHIWFCDDIFGLKPGWIKEFAGLVEKEKLDFRFKIQARADLLVTEDNIKCLARAGCEDIWMGAESGSQKILDAMDKGTTIGQIYTATRLIRENGIKASFFIQFGYLGETKQDILQTIHMIKELLPDNMGISVSYPLPGTVFYEKVKAQLSQKSNWTDSDELKLMFKSTFTPAFYKQLHSYVHKTYRRQLALKNIKNMFLGTATLTWTGIKKSASVLYYSPMAFLAKCKLSILENRSS